LTSSTRSLGDGAVLFCQTNIFLNMFSSRRGDVPDLTADPALAEQELGFKAPQELETMCRDLWNWQTKNPLGYGDH
jgi:UDP-glucose 4-epimerase